ncbi:MAG: response regulator [Phycisphaerales bacterium]|nr:MAG: response regulator [Phycisphaerales bacterium]
MGAHKSVLTTGEVAKICNVAPRTVSKWFDAGQLCGYRIPGSKDRRIPVDQLVRFMRSHGIPFNGLDDGALRLLVIDADFALNGAVKDALESDGLYEVYTAESAFEGGAAAQDVKPHALVIDVTLRDVTPRAIIRWVRSCVAMQGTCIIGVANDMSEGTGQELLQTGFDGYLSKPFSARSLIELIERHVTKSMPEQPAAS